MLYLIIFAINLGLFKCSVVNNPENSCKPVDPMINFDWTKVN